MYRRDFIKLGATGLAFCAAPAVGSAEIADSTLSMFLANLKHTNDACLNPIFCKVPIILRSDVNTRSAMAGKLLTTDAVCRISPNVDLKAKYLPDGQPQRVVKLIKTWKSITAQILAEDTLNSLNEQIADIFLSRYSLLYSDRGVFDRIVQIHKDYGNKGYDRVTLCYDQAEELFSRHSDKLNKYCIETGLEVVVSRGFADNKSMLYCKKRSLIFTRSVDDYDELSWNICLNSTEDSYVNNKVRVVSSFCFNYSPNNVLVAC